MAFSLLKGDSEWLSGNQFALKFSDPVPSDFPRGKPGAPGITIWGLCLPPLHKRDIEQILFLFSCETICVNIHEWLHPVYLKILFKNAKVHTVSLKQMSITLWSSR